MNELLAEYKRETGLSADINISFQDIDADEMNDPTEKKLTALELIKSDGFLSKYYILDKDFFDWVIEKASKR